MVGAFFIKISIAPSGETIALIKKSWGGAKMGRTSFITMPSMVGIVGRAPAVDEKVWCFFVCLFVTLWNYKVCDNGNVMKQWNLSVMVQLHRGRFLVVYLYFLYRPPRFFLRGKFIPKIAILGDFGGCKPQKWKLAWLWVRGRPSPTPNFVKLLKGIYLFGANIG